MFCTHSAFGWQDSPTPTSHIRLTLQQEYGIRLNLHLTLEQSVDFRCNPNPTNLFRWPHPHKFSNQIGHKSLHLHTFNSILSKQGAAVFKWLQQKKIYAFTPVNRLWEGRTEIILCYSNDANDLISISFDHRSSLFNYHHQQINIKYISYSIHQLATKTLPID